MTAEVIEEVETPVATPSKTVSWEVVRNFLEQLGITENDLVQKIEVSSMGVLITCAFVVDGQRFTVETPEGDDSELTYHRFLGIEFPQHEHEHPHPEEGLTTE